MTPLFNAENYFALMRGALERHEWEEAAGWKSELFSALCGIEDEIKIQLSRKEKREIAAQNAEQDE